MSIVYILKNQSMPDILKVGITDNLERRIKELDNTSTPLPFECIYAVEVEDASKIGIFASESWMNSSFIHADPFGKISLMNQGL